MIWKDQIYCEGDGCIRFDRCSRALTPAVKADAERRGKLLDFYRDPLKLTCWTDRLPTDEEVQEAIDRIDPPEKIEEPQWDD